jgi:hypothetical protein
MHRSTSLKKRNSSFCQRFRNGALSLPTLALFIGALFFGAATAQAQTATIYGSLSNFDVVNNTGEDAHGFEIELEGLQPQDVYYTFSAQRYGSPAIVPSATGVFIRWTSGYDTNLQQFLQTTIARTAHTPFAGTCYQWGGTSYATSGCEHFGVTLRASAVRTIYRWLVTDAQQPGALVAVNPPVNIPAPVYVVLPPAQPAEAPVLEAAIEAPEPAEAPELYGNAQWVKVFKTEMAREVTLDELVGDNPVVPQDPAHAEVAWEILQAEPASNSNGNRRRRQNSGNLNAGTRSVIRRYEIYQYTGGYDPITHQALCADVLCNAPQAGELGDYIGAQMGAVNVAVPAVTVAKVGNGEITTADRLIRCGATCTAYYNVGTVVTLTATPARGSVFTGWTGACNGAQATCTVTVNEANNVTATFASVFTLSVKTSGKGAVNAAAAGIGCGSGGSCSASVREGTAVTLTAVPSAGFKFTNWTGGFTGTASTLNITVTKDTQVQANFSKQ